MVSERAPLSILPSLIKHDITSGYQVRTYCYSVCQGEKVGSQLDLQVLRVTQRAVRGLLRRDKSTVTSASSTIIIDKHELHPTWPVYSQHETRQHAEDGVTLTVDRSHTCYGPGDRIVVMATVKAQPLQTHMLRGFEFALRETTVFRASPHTTGKKGAPQVKVNNISERKVPVNVTLYGGTQHKAELTVTVPPHHTSATLNAARHIDIMYVLQVKALLGTGQSVTLDLPVVVSNWPRFVRRCLSCTQPS